MVIRIERHAPARMLLALTVIVLLITSGCRDPRNGAAEASGENWSVTAWGTLFEVFPEIEPLVAGQTAIAHTHVTRLEDFLPLTQGEVAIVLSGASGEQVFGVDRPVRPGIYQIEINPRSPGEYDLAFRIRTRSGSEEIRGGTVRVGTAEDPGGIVRAPAPRGATGGGAPVGFLKEQQWRSALGTEWVRNGMLSQSTSGLATVRPPAGGETAITAPVDGVVHPSAGAWPYPGVAVARGRALFQLVPRTAADVSLASLEAAVSELETDLATARARLSRLEELFSLQAVSRRELEEARARVQTLEARRRASRQDLAAAQSSRGGGAAGSLTIRAPFAGEIASVTATPGTTVAAGDELARLVRTDSLWLEIALPPSGAREIAAGVAGVVLVDREGPPIRITDGLRLISVAPVISRETGTVTVLIEMPPDAGLALGVTVEAHVLTTVQRPGVVIPSTAVVDDGGVPIVYLQLGGESFVRQEISVLSRQGDLMLVDHLVPGQRLVTRGGNAIRRASLLSSGAVEGHVH
ncbi:MAG TPA: efflux RND transporter periplasmic adaptor subunit [Thermoanaerobaculia bacterium]|nr:efflux RND transporter periplasmic adaptor subunit [Thermoanaerobaculia bacterium]